MAFKVELHTEDHTHFVAREGLHSSIVKMGKVTKDPYKMTTKK